MATISNKRSLPPEGPEVGDLNGASWDSNADASTMRPAKALRPMEAWVCPGCSNENFANRLFCNMRNCQLARPGLTAMELNALQKPVNIAPQFVAAKFGPSGVLGQPAVMPVSQSQPQGSWKCQSCGNINYPLRTHCNSKRCGKPREEVDGGAPETFGVFPGVFGGPMTTGLFTLPTRVTMPVQMPLAPPGSWVCLACQNVNYPLRTSCNGKNCGRPREGVDGGAPGTAAVAENSGLQAGTMMGLSGIPPVRCDGLLVPQTPAGSWICPTCQNVNYPNRTHCNKHSCGLPRPA